MSWFIRKVKDTDDEVPFDLIELDEKSSPIGFAIRKLVPRWNVSDAELEEFAVAPVDKKARSEDIVENAPARFHNFLLCAKYLEPENEYNKLLGLIDQLEDAITRYCEELGEAIKFERKQSWCSFFLGDTLGYRLAKRLDKDKTLPRSSDEMKRKLNYVMAKMMRHVLTPTFVRALIGRIREFLAAKPDDADPEEGYGPFPDRATALAALLTTYDSLLTDHFDRWTEQYYLGGRWDDCVGHSEAANHWSLMMLALRAEVNERGPLPDRLMTVYRTFAFASRLERIDEHEWKLVQDSEDPTIVANREKVTAVRESYGVTYETW